MDQESVALPPTVVCFGPSPSYGIHTAHEAREWFLSLVQSSEEFEVETNVAGEPPLSFWSEILRRVAVE